MITIAMAAVIDAGQPRVWRALTDPEERVSWDERVLDEGWRVKVQDSQAEFKIVAARNADDDDVSPRKILLNGSGGPWVLPNAVSWLDFQLYPKTDFSVLPGVT